MGRPTCDHYAGVPCRDAHDGLERVYVIWTAGTAEKAAAAATSSSAAGHIGCTRGCLNRGGRCGAIGCGQLLCANLSFGVDRSLPLGLTSRHLVLQVAANSE